MKLMISAFVFATTLTLGLQTLASTQEHGDMNALFPPPQANTALAQPPAKVELESPTYYQKISDSKITLTWKTVADATEYHVQVATDPNFKWLVKEDKYFKGQSMEVGELQAGKHYFWRVAALKSGNKNGNIKGPYATSMFEAAGK